MSAMLQALGEMVDGGELLMFTDASAKDSAASVSVDIVALQKKVKVVQRAFGSCSPIDPGYIRLANDTGGQLFVLSPDEAGKITKLADFDTNPNAVDLLYVHDTLAGAPKTFDVPVDSTMQRATFSVSGTTDVTVTRPNGSVVTATDGDVETILLSTGAVYSVVNPTPGTWRVRVNGAGAFSISVTGESSLDFTFFNFVEVAGPPLHEGYFRIKGFPLTGQAGKVLAQVSAKANTAQFEFRAPDGNLLQTLNLSAVGWPQNPLPGGFAPSSIKQYIGETIPTNAPFRVYVTGLDVNGVAYQRIISGIIRPQTIRVVPPAPVPLSPGTSTSYTFKAQNFGAAGTFKMSATDDNHFFTTISPSTVTLATNETKDVTVVLKTPEAPGGTALDTLTVSIRSSSDPEAFNYAEIKSIVKPTSPLVFDAATLAETMGNGDGIIQTGESASLSARLINIGGADSTNIRARLSTPLPSVSINSDTSDYPDIQPGGTAANSIPFTFTVTQDLLCGQTLNFTLSVQSGDSAKLAIFNFPVQLGQVSADAAPAQTFSYAGPPVPIPDDNVNGVSIPLNVSGIDGAISDLNFSFDGSACTADAGATTVGLDHTWVGDLVVQLTSPRGTTVTLINTPGDGGNSGNNFCNTLLDDQATTPIQKIEDFGVPPAGPPYTGSFKPASPLAAFKGENPNGTWLLHVADGVSSDSGSVRAFSLIVSGAQCPTFLNADLSLNASAVSGPVLTGSDLTHTLTVANNGPGAAHDVVVTNNLSAQLTFVSCSATGGGACGGAGNNRTVTFPTLAAGATETLTFVSTLACPTADATALTSEASVNSSTPDPNPGNNAAALTITAANPQPVLTHVATDKQELWPANHKMVDVTVSYTVTDNCGPLTNSLRVESNEPVNDTGDGNTSPDWEVIDEQHVRLRAERAGSGSGRIYTISVTSTDNAGTTSTKSVAVRVPKSRS